MVDAILILCESANQSYIKSKRQKKKKISDWRGEALSLKQRTMQRCDKGSLRINFQPLYHPSQKVTIYLQAEGKRLKGDHCRIHHKISTHEWSVLFERYPSIIWLIFNTMADDIHHTFSWTSAVIFLKLSSTQANSSPNGFTSREYSSVGKG